MKHTYAEIKKQDPDGEVTWNSAIRCLQKGDHYILVMWGGVQPIVPAVVTGAVVLMLAIFTGLNWLTKRFPPPNSQLLLGIFAGATVVALLFPRTLGNIANWITDRALLRFFLSREEKEE